MKGPIGGPSNGPDRQIVVKIVDVAGRKRTEGLPVEVANLLNLKVKQLGYLPGIRDAQARGKGCRKVAHFQLLATELAPVLLSLVNPVEAEGFRQLQNYLR